MTPDEGTLGIRSVVLSRRVKKGLRKVPGYLLILLQNWIDDVEDRGLEEVRKIPGYHDEPLKGRRTGQRSIRLTRAWRAIYRVMDGHPVFVLVEEVHKHDY